MDRVWIPISVITVTFVTYIIADVSIMSAPTKVVIFKPGPSETYEKISKSDSNTKSEIQKEPNTGVKKLTTTLEDKRSSHKSGVNSWPRVFVLSDDPHYPVICYSGTTININKTEKNNSVISTLEDEEENGNNDSKTNGRTTKKFILSADPLYPVLCQEGHIPRNLTDDGTVEEGGISYETSNVTCIRRDYEKNISAIFLNKPGHIHAAWNIFNSSIEYGYFNIQNVENIGHIKVLHETIVDCDAYDFEIDDKHIGASSAAALLG